MSQIFNKVFGFLDNQIFEPSYVYNKNEEQVYNKIHIGK